MKTLKQLLRLPLLLILTILLSYCSKDDGIEPNPIDETPTPIEEVSSTPIFKLTNPPRGAFLQEGTTDDMIITVEGEACDSINPITGITINGSSAVLGGTGDCRTFSSDVTSSWGLNIIDGFAENDLGDEVALVQSYIRSDRYSPAPTTSKSYNNHLIPGAWRSRLGQEAFDDGDRSDIDDFATVLQRVINTVDFDALAPTVLYDNITSTTDDCLVYDLTRRNGVKVQKNGTMTFDQLTIDQLLAKPGSIEVGFSMSNLNLPLSVTAFSGLVPCVPEIEIATTGSVGFSNASVSGIFDVSFNGDEIEVLLKQGSANVNINNPFININLTGNSTINNLISDASTFVLSFFVNNIEDMLTDTLTDAIKPALKGLFNGLGIDEAIPLPKVDVTLIVESNIDHAKVDEGFIDLGLNANVTPSVFKKSTAQLANGSIIGTSILPSFEGMNGSLGMGMKHDFTNQVLWAVWAGGGLDFPDGTTAEITDAVNNNGLDATITSIETTLPPVLMPSDVDSQIKIGIGDILTEAKVPPSSLGLPNVGSDIEISVYVSIILTCKFLLNPETNELSFELIGEPETHVQIKDVVRNPAVEVLESQFANVISAIIKERIFGVVKSIDLPSIPISALPGIPAGSTWVLDNGQIDQSSGYFRLIGGISVVVE